MPACCGELVARDRREVEPDQRHDRARHHRRQEELDHAVAEPVDDQADQEQADARDQDPAQRSLDAAMRLRGDHRRDEREARAGVRRHPVLRQQVEEDRADAGEEDRRRDGEARQHRHQRGRAEHREDVLRAEAEHRRHVQPLVRPHDRARLDRAPVPVDLPNPVQTGSHIPLLVAADAPRGCHILAGAARTFTCARSSARRPRRSTRARSLPARSPRPPSGRFPRRVGRSRTRAQPRTAAARPSARRCSCPMP